MNSLAPLLADIDPALIKIIVAVVIFTIAGIGQLLAKIRQMQPPPGGGPQAPRPAQPVPREVADEIEDFLRRAVEGRKPQDARPARPPQSSPAAAAPVRAEVVAKTRKPVGEQVGEHVNQYLDEQEFSRRGDELGKEVATADREIGQRLHQVFDHRVSQLEAVPGEAAKPPTAYEPPDLVGAGADIPSTFATGLLDLVESPDSLRQAIILNEILHRPEERWG
jgi:hypothetical protein